MRGRVPIARLRWTLLGAGSTRRRRTRSASRARPSRSRWPVQHRLALPRPLPPGRPRVRGRPTTARAARRVSHTGPGRDPHRPTRSGGEHGRADRPMDGRKGRQRRARQAKARATATHPASCVSGLRDPLPLTLAPDGSVPIGDWDPGIIYQVARRALARPGRSRVVLRVTWRELRESRSPSRELSSPRVRRPCSDSYSSCHLGQSSDAAPSWWNCRSSTSTSTSTRRLRSRHRHPPTRRSRRTSRGVASVALHLLCFDCIKPSPQKM